MDLRSFDFEEFLGARGYRGDFVDRIYSHKGNYDSDKFKIYMADTGLLIAQLDDEAQRDLRANENLGVYKGGLYENIVKFHGGNVGFANNVLALPYYTAFLLRRFLAENAPA